MKTLISVIFAFAIPSAATALDVTARGLPGHVLTPSGLAWPDGEVVLTFGKDQPTETLSLGFQALPNVQTSLSFTEYTDVGGGLSSEITSLNLAVRLLNETRMRPALTLGIDGLFSNDRDSSEYLVASKRIGPDLTASLGLGWGRLGSSADISNGTRPARDASDFTAFDHLLQGPIGVFGGITWHTPIEGLSVSAEYSSDNFASEAFDPSTRLNFGARYVLAKGITLAAYSRGGETFGFSVTVSGNPAKPYAPPHVGTGPTLVRPWRADVGADTTWTVSEETRTALRTQIAEALAEQGIRLRAFHAEGKRLSVGIEPASSGSWPKLVGRTSRVLASMAPASVSAFRISLIDFGLPVKTVMLSRASVHGNVDIPSGSAAVWEAADISAGAPDIEWQWNPPAASGLSWSVTPAVQIDITSDDRFDPIAKLRASARYTFSEKFYVAGSLGYQLAGRGQQTARPATPMPRSDGSSYDRKGVQLDSLWFNYRTKLASDVHARFSSGLFERQYGGASVEMLWVPAARNFALGADLTYAKKRDYDDAFKFLDFDTVTGHASVYWDTGYRGVSTQVDVGRYLAGDWGATLTLSRYFPNGWEVSAYTTLTEGNRDSKVQIGALASIPFAWTAPVRSRQRSTLRLGGISGDFGSRVRVPDRLYPIVRDTGRQRLEDSWGEFWK